MGKASTLDGCDDPEFKIIVYFPKTSPESL